MSSWTPPDTTSRPVAVIGGGVLGRRLCMMWACNGSHVILYDRTKETEDQALKFVEENLDAQVKVVNGKRGKVTSVDSLAEAVQDAWMVIEAIPEILDLKIDIFGELDALTQPDCILATNSSSYKSREIIGKVKRTYRVCNGHYYMPPLSDCVEFMTCGYTDPAIFPFLLEQSKAVGFIPVHAKVESTGLVFNRIWAAMKREALSVLAEGVATPAEIDLLYKANWGTKVGICEAMDDVGLDTVYNIEVHYVRERGLPSTNVEWLKANYLDHGKLGAKSGEGLLVGRK